MKRPVILVLMASLLASGSAFAREASNDAFAKRMVDAAATRHNDRGNDRGHERGNDRGHNRGYEGGNDRGHDRGYDRNDRPRNDYRGYNPPDRDRHDGNGHGNGNDWNDRHHDN